VRFKLKHKLHSVEFQSKSDVNFTLKIVPLTELINLTIIGSYFQPQFENSQGRSLHSMDLVVNR